MNSGLVGETMSTKAQPMVITKKRTPWPLWLSVSVMAACGGTLGYIIGLLVGRH